MYPLLPLLLCGLLFSANAAAQINTDKLEDLFTELHVRGDFNGSVLVARKGKVIYERHLGLADRERRRPITNNTVFELASVSKQFTAMAIMILQEQGMICYDDPVSKYLEDFPYPAVSIRNLLNMASGIPDYHEFPSLFKVGKILSNQDLYHFYVSEKPTLVFPPNTQFAYANINYVLLAEVIEEAAGTNFSCFLDEYVFAPAGMTSTRSYTNRFTEGEVIQDYAYPYVMVGEELIRAEKTPATKSIVKASAIEGDGSIVSTLYDLLKWTVALKESRLVSAATLAEAYTSPVFIDGSLGTYGFGMNIGTDKVWHWGGWPGVQTSFTRYFDKDDTVAIYLKNVESHDWSWLGDFDRFIRN